MCIRDRGIVQSQVQVQPLCRRWAEAYADLFIAAAVVSSAGTDADSVSAIIASPLIRPLKIPEPGICDMDPAYDRPRY